MIVLIWLESSWEEVYIGRLLPPKTFNWTCEEKRMSIQELFKRKKMKELFLSIKASLDVISGIEDCYFHLEPELYYIAWGRLRFEEDAWSQSITYSERGREYIEWLALNLRQVPGVEGVEILE